MFSYEALDQATGAYQKLVRKIAGLKNGGDIDQEFVNQAKATFIEKVGSDMNTALGITCIYDILKANTTDASKLKAIEEIDGSVLCVGLIDSANALNSQTAVSATENTQSADIDPELKAKIEDLIAQRASAKKEKNFARADEIRAELSSMGVTIKDTREGTTYTVE